MIDESVIAQAALEAARKEAGDQLRWLARNQPAVFRRGVVGLLERKPSAKERREERDYLQGLSGTEFSLALEGLIQSRSYAEALDLLAGGRHSSASPPGLILGSPSVGSGMEEDAESGEE